VIFGWLKRRRRRKIVAAATNPEWSDIFLHCVPFYRNWPGELKDKLADTVKILIAEKNWEGCDDLVLTEEMKVVISAQIARMLVGTEGYYFDGVLTILVYPQSFERESRNGLLVGSEHRAGEAWQGGPIVLSWRDVANYYEGHNLVIHEFAHHLDGIDGMMSGDPVFGTRDGLARWQDIAKREYAQLMHDVNSGQQTVLDPYGTKNKAEFFAVASEAFFEIPSRLKHRHSELYDSLAEVYNLNPLEWNPE